ncbi:MAG: NAD-dependent epimerase/dehydratase family protein [Candidatus Omnitrophica bacterium]|nr:NAD-dependent epimerase/dehydratase family protein [Candidatus Omnitrophota bacterium]
MISKHKAVFLTGGTGLVGSYLLKLLLSSNRKVYVLARDKDRDCAKYRVIKLLQFWNNAIAKNKIRNLFVLKGDITKENLGLDKNTISLLSNEVEEVFHSAAATQFNKGLLDLRNINVLGTRRLLNLGLKWVTTGSLRRINYLSTAYICGNYSGVFKESDLDLGQEFATPYEQAKFETEEMLHDYRKKGLWIDIFRCPAIVGEYSSGKIHLFNQALYQALHILSLGIFEYFPINDNQKFNMVCIDELCKSILSISNSSLHRNITYHNFANQSLSLKYILNLFIKFLNLKKLKYISQKEFLQEKSTVLQRRILEYNFFFIYSKAKLDSRYTNNLLKCYGFCFSEINEKILLKLFNYPLKKGFIKKK